MPMHLRTSLATGLAASLLLAISMQAMALDDQPSPVEPAPSVTTTAAPAEQAPTTPPAAANKPSETEILLAEETARLDALEAEILTASQQLAARENALQARRETLLGWQRRLRELRDTPVPQQADTQYVALRIDLKQTREALERSLDEIADDTSLLPVLGANPLALLEATEKIRALAERRSELEQRISVLREREMRLQKDDAANALDVMVALNTERLALMPLLSDKKRAEITGFSEAAWDQAKAEVWHLSLIAREHAFALQEWLTDTQNWNGARLWWAAVGVTPAILCILAFLWLRRISPTYLSHLDQRLAQREIAQGQIRQGLSRSLVQVVAGIERPLSWLLLFFVLVALSPANVDQWLEVRIATVVTGWVLAGWLTVLLLNSLAALGSRRHHGAFHSEPGTRLRSLQLIGRVFIGIAVTLAVTTELVGQGTVYSWILTTSWIAAVPVIIVLVRWWREPVFARIGRITRKSSVEQWVADHPDGVLGFFAVITGGSVLLVSAVLGLVRRTAGGFDVVRRGYAILFRQELDKLSRKSARQLLPLTDKLNAALSPALPQKEWLATPEEKILADIETRVKNGTGGIIAVIGNRGMGKSSLLTALANRNAGSLLVHGRALSPDAHIDQVCAGYTEKTPLVLIDDAQRLFRSTLGGLHTFDRIHTHVRQHAATTVWVYAIDATCWPFLKRARDAQPLFDKVLTCRAWNEQEIGELLMARSSQAGMTPSFEDLLGAPPQQLDELVLAEELHIRQQGYFRMLWDQANGNPGIALEIWRQALACDEAGKVFVRTPRSPDSTLLDGLPDSSLFVLRAVLQMEPAETEAIAEATRVPIAQVIGVLQRGVQAHYLLEDQGCYTVSWPWLRTVRDLLERRHLLQVMP